MGWARIILDGIAMSAAFSLATGLLILVNPRIFRTSCSREIQELAPPHPKERTCKLLFSLPAVVPARPYGVLSAWAAGLEGFAPLRGGFCGVVHRESWRFPWAGPLPAREDGRPAGAARYGGASLLHSARRAQVFGPRGARAGVAARHLSALWLGSGFWVRCCAWCGGGVRQA